MFIKTICETSGAPDKPSGEHHSKKANTGRYSDWTPTSSHGPLPGSQSDWTPMSVLPWTTPRSSKWLEPYVHPPMDHSQVVKVTGPLCPSSHGPLPGHHSDWTPMSSHGPLPGRHSDWTPMSSHGLLYLFSCKMTDRSSPSPSPMKLTRSPLPKIQRRLRTRTERKEQHLKPSFQN